MSSSPPTITVRATSTVPPLFKRQWLGANDPIVPCARSIGAGYTPRLDEPFPATMNGPRTARRRRAPSYTSYYTSTTRYSTPLRPHSTLLNPLPTLPPPHQREVAHPGRRPRTRRFPTTNCHAHPPPHSSPDRLLGLCRGGFRPRRTSRRPLRRRAAHPPRHGPAERYAGRLLRRPPHHSGRCRY